MDEKFEKTHPEAVIAHLKRQKAALLSENKIKDRALVVARGVLEELAAFIWEEFEDKMMREHILRARDQIMNARLGKLSSDPFPISEGLAPDQREWEVMLDEDGWSMSIRQPGEGDRGWIKVREVL